MTRVDNQSVLTLWRDHEWIFLTINLLTSPIHDHRFLLCSQFWVWKDAEIIILRLQSSESWYNEIRAAFSITQLNNPKINTFILIVACDRHLHAQSVLSLSSSLLTVHLRFLNVWGFQTNSYGFIGDMAQMQSEIPLVSLVDEKLASREQISALGTFQNSVVPLP